MKIIGGILLVAAVVWIGSGCTTPPDWIARTLVTVDVTGTWYGNEQGQGTFVNAELWLDLLQAGPKVKGSAKVVFTGSSSYETIGLSGPIEGTIAGDVFTFRHSNDTRLMGDLTVRGDEMTGEVKIGARRIVLLRRVGSSSRPDSQLR